MLQSIHYARSGISRSGDELRRHHGTLFNQDMEPKGDFFLENHPAKILHWAPRESLSIGIRNAPTVDFFFGFCRHIASAPITAGTHTSGVQ